MKRTRFRSSPLFSAGLAILAAFSLAASQAIAGTPKRPMSRLRISLKLTLPDGRQVRSKSFVGNEKAIALSVADLPSGTYTLEVVFISGSSTRKNVSIVH